MRDSHIIALIAVLTMLGGAAVALGVKTPQSRATALEMKADDHEKRIGSLETGQAVTNARLDAIAGGIEELVGHPLEKKHGR